MEVIPQINDNEPISKQKEGNLINDLNVPILVEKMNQDDLDIPPPPNSLVPPPPYSQWDELSIEQLLEKSREVLTAECLGGDKKEKEGEVLDKMTQLESLVSSLQTILSDQTFAMHDLKYQLSDIQTVLKKMQDKQDTTISSEEVMKQVMAITENIIATSDIKKQIEANNAIKLSAAKQLQKEEETVSENEKSTEFVQPPSSTEELQFSTNLPSITSMSRTVSRQPSRTVSRAPSRNPSRPSSRSVSRTVSPACTPVSLSRTSSRNKLEVQIPSTVAPLNKVNDFPPIDENCEKDDDEDDEGGEGETALDRLIRNTASLLTEATEAVELPVKGREKDGTISIVHASEIDFSDIYDQLDGLEGSEEDDEEEFEESPIEMNSLSPDGAEFSSKEARWPRKHKRTKSGSNKDDFLKSLTSFSNSMTDLENFIGGLTEDLPQDEPNSDGMIHYNVTDNDLIQNPSSDVPDLDDFAQQCRLLTRALILPFLHATHSFMSESLKTTNNIQAPRSVTSTTRTFMNLMYWTFLFTLGSLVLDAWLCEVAGRQVIRMVELLKPGQPFGFIANGYGGYSTIDDQQDGGIGMLDDGKKKNVKFSTRPKVKAVTWKGTEKGIVGNGRKWLKGVEGVLGGRWCTRSTVGRFEDEEYSEESDEWEIVDFDSSDGEDTVSEEEGNEEDPALLLRRRITNERLSRAGHVNNAHEKDTKKEEENNVNNDVSSVKNQECDIQDENLAQTILEDSAFTEEPECDAMEEDDYYYYDDDNDLNIPGSFPTAFKWTPPQSKMVDIRDRVRRVRSVVLCRPKRSGPFGGSGGFWVMNTRKVRTISKGNKDRDVLKISNKSNPIIKNKSSKSSSIQKRTWVRRNSI